MNLKITVVMIMLITGGWNRYRYQSNRTKTAALESPFASPAVIPC